MATSQPDGKYSNTTGGKEFDFNKIRILQSSLSRPLYCGLGGIVFSL
jgi:hypothetical protein